MGESESFCALCSACLSTALQFGSKKPRYLARRRMRVDRKAEGLASDDESDTNNDGDGKGEDSDIDMEDAKSDAPDDPDGTEAESEDEDRSSDENFDSGSSDSSSDWVSEEDSADFSDLNEDGEIENVEVEPSEDEEQGASDAVSVWSSDGEVSVFFDVHKVEEGDDMFRYQESHSYDPTLISKDDIKWLGRGRCLAFNPETSGLTKAFISARGTYDSFGYFSTKNPSSDPNASDDLEWPCFISYDVDKPVGFPFHENCYKIFARCLFGTPDYGRIDKDALYSAMEQAGVGFTKSLNLPYGEFSGADQFWDCCEGEEYIVTDPGQSLRVSEALHEVLPAQLFTTPKNVPDLAHKVKNDPFRLLPYDILYMIFPYLHTDNILDLMKASWHINSSTRNNDIWNNLLNTRIFPWFWEAEDLCKNSTLASDHDPKRTFIWLNKISTPKIGKRGVFMGLANRRRIWTACEDLKSIYESFAPIDASADSADDEDAKDIMERAMSLQMPMVAYPKPQSVSKVISTQWVKSWSDIDSRSCVFETYWRTYGGDLDDFLSTSGSLTGIGVIFGTDERRFNYTESSKEELVCRTATIEYNDWIKELILHIKAMDMLTIEGDRSDIRTALEVPRRATFIVGVTIVLNSGIRYDLCGDKELAPGLDQRVLAASNGQSIVGIAGQVGENQVIATLGVLQCARPGWEPSSIPSLPQLQRILWAEQATKLPTPSTSASLSDNIPVWHYPELSLSVSSVTSHENQVPMQMLPHQVLLWAPMPSSYRDLTAISALCVDVGIGKYNNGGAGPVVTKARADIVGMRAEYVHDDETKFMEIGTGGPVPSMTDRDWTDIGQQKEHGEFALNPDPNPKPWNAHNTKRFEIDGRGGEVVTSVHVSEDAKAIKLRTNKGRECYWGEPDRAPWTTIEAEEGRVIVGLVVCFGVLGGWNWRHKGHSHMKIASVSAVTMPI